MGFVADLLGFEDAPPPDPQIGEAAKANAAIAGRMQTLAEQQYSDQKALLAEYAPMLKDAISKSITAQDASTARSDSAWGDYTSTWRPVEQQMAQKSLDWATPGRIEQNAQTAATGVAGQFDQARGANRENMIRSGLDPSAIASLEAAGRLEEAKATAGAANTARRDTEKEGMAYLDNAARFGRNMTSTGIATASLAGSQGQQAQGGYGALTAATAAPAAGAGSLFSGAVGANNAAGSLAATSWNQANAGVQASNGFIGDIIGAGAKTAGMIFGSSEDTKDIDGSLNGNSASEAVASSGSKRWRYKPGEGDGNTKARLGPTAESLADVAPEVSDGKQVDGIAMLGLHHAAIGDQHKRLKKLEKRLSAKEA